jgi:type IV secretory pathway protease TraF
VLLRLPDQVVLELYKRGYMRLIHYMLASQKQVAHLARKKNSRVLQGTENLAGARAPVMG